MAAQYAGQLYRQANFPSLTLSQSSTEAGASLSGPTQSVPINDIWYLQLATAAKFALLLLAAEGLKPGCHATACCYPVIDEGEKLMSITIADLLAQTLANAGGKANLGGHGRQPQRPE